MNRNRREIMSLCLVLGMVLGCIASGATIHWEGKDGNRTAYLPGIIEVPILEGNFLIANLPAATKSVVVSFDQGSKPENVAPFYVMGDVGGVPKMVKISAGQHTVSAVAKSGKNGTGKTLDSVSVTATLKVKTAPGPDPDPEPPAPTRLLADYGILQMGDRQSVLSSTIVSSSKLSFLVPRDRWKYLEPSDGNYQFDVWLREVRRYRAAGKNYVVPVMTGGGSTPDHVVGTRFSRPNESPTLPPWSASIPVEYRKLHVALSNAVVDPATGLKVKDDPYNVGVWITGCTVPSQEAHLNGMEKAPGYSATGMRANWKACGQVIRDCYPTKPAIYSLSGQAKVQEYQPGVIADLKAMFGKNVYFQHNSFKAEFSPTATHVVVLKGLANEGYRTGVEAVCCAADNPERFGSSNVMDGINAYPFCDYFVNYQGDLGALK